MIGSREHDVFIGNVADPMWVANGFGKDVHVPTHFESRDLKFGAELWNISEQ